MIEKVQIALSEISEHPTHEWKGVTWGREDSNQAMTEVSVTNINGNYLDVWVQGSVGGEKIAMRIEDVSELYITTQGAWEPPKLS